jgi:DNA-binding response OmpR family regulator
MVIPGERAMNVPYAPRTWVRPTSDYLPEEPITIVFFEQNTVISETYRMKLELDGYQVKVINACEDALQELPSRSPDIIFLDASSSAPNERILLEGLRGHPATRQIPIIILSDRTAGQLALDGINLGPLEYLVPCQNVSAA